jgi:hypothetical protein
MQQEASVRTSRWSIWFLGFATTPGAQLTFAHDGHWHPTGHQLAAEIILDSPLFDGLRAETPTEPVKSQH